MQLDFRAFYIMVYNLLFRSIPVRHWQANDGSFTTAAKGVYQPCADCLP